MSKMVKGLITGALAGRYTELDSALLVEFVGVDGNTSNEFRGALRQQDIRLEIIKNSLARKAIAEGPLSPLGGDLKGPSALLTGGDSLIDVAKLVDEWKKKVAGLKLKAAVLEGEYLDNAKVQGLHKMASKADLQSRIAGALLAPGANLAGAALAPGRNLAGCLKAMIEKLENGEEIKAA